MMWILTLDLIGDVWSQEAALYVVNTKSIEEALSIFTEVSILIITRYAISFVNLKGEGERERGSLLEVWWDTDCFSS